MAKIDKTVFTAQIEAVNTILQLCYTLRDYVNSLIDQGNASIDDIATINNSLLTITNNISDLSLEITNNTHNINLLGSAIGSINDSITALNNTLTTKLDKVTDATQVMQAYVKLDNGTNQMLNVHWDNIRDTIPIRDQTGNIRVATTPTVATHATSKSYVDNAISSISVSQLYLLSIYSEDSSSNFMLYTSNKGNFDLNTAYNFVDDTNTYLLSDALTTSLISILSSVSIGADNAIPIILYDAYSNGFINGCTNSLISIKDSNGGIFEVDLSDKSINTNLFNANWKIIIKQV